MRPLRQYRKSPFLISKDLNQFLLRRDSFSKEKKICFVTGVQRSGTNMMMDLIERHPDTYVYKESDSRAFDDYMLRTISYIKKLLKKTIPTHIIIKALSEAHDLYWILDVFGDAKVIWIYRDYPDVINSNQRQFSLKRNYLDEIVKDPRRGFWRGLGMTEETLAIVRAHYDKDMNDESAQALFWYYRNQLFFDQKFDMDPRVILIKYEPFVMDPSKYIDFIFDFIGLVPKKNLVKQVHSTSIRKNEAPSIRPDIVELCDGMRVRLDGVFEKKVKCRSN